MRANLLTHITLAGVTGLALLAGGCGSVARSGRAPVQIVLESLQGASGATPDKFGGTLFSDVVTNVKRTVNGQEVQVPTVYSDTGQVQMSLLLKDPGTSGFPASPTALNQVTFTRYRVTYRRSDGRNTPGIDVPYPLDNGLTFTVPAEGNVVAAFEIVRHVAKGEAPLSALTSSGVIIKADAEVSFFGSDQAGNEVIATGHLGVEFGNFGDPQ